MLGPLHENNNPPTNVKLNNILFIVLKFVREGDSNPNTMNMCLHQLNIQYFLPSKIRQVNHLRDYYLSKMSIFLTPFSILSLVTLFFNSALNDLSLTLIACNMKYGLLGSAVCIVYEYTPMIFSQKF